MKMNKLTKIENNYHLENNGDIIAGSHVGDKYEYKLSIKNCEAIENGYDLGEIRKLADENFECELGDGPTNNESINSMLKKSNANGAEWGFKQAFELLGDKKFSEENLREAYDRGVLGGDSVIDRYIKALQQTEWDVEIIMENSLTNGYKNQPENVFGFIAEYKLQPKLDEDGCLILKRK